ncbi:MAG: carbohydrate kinase family protein [Candidatus Korobacteraceae bacterium]
MRIVSVGEILWDVIGDREYLGGAPLNFAAHARQLGHEVFLLSAVGEDDRGRRALRGLRERGISTEFVQVLSGKDTGIAEVELDTDGKPMFRIVRPAAYDFVELSPAQLQHIAELQPDWIYFGTLYHTSGQALASTLKLLKGAPNARRFYDVNLREGNWSLAVVEQLSGEANVVKLSESEAEFLDAGVNAPGDHGSPVEDFCRRWSEQYRCGTICVTFGERGCAIFKGGVYCEIPGFKVEVADTVGAGDAFSAAFVHGMAQSWDAQLTGSFANAVGVLVASRPGATPEWHIEECLAMLGRKNL